MKLTKRLGALMIALVMIFTMLPLTTASAATSGTITLKLNDTSFSVNGVPQQIDAQGSKATANSGYTMLPLRAVVEATGGSLSWDSATNNVTIIRGSNTVVLNLNGSKVATINGDRREMYIAPYAVNGRTMVHIRTLELLGMKVDWNGDTSTISVNYVDPSSIKAITLVNAQSMDFTEVNIAPTGSSNWSGNLLAGSTLGHVGAAATLTVQAPITGSGYYDLQCKTANGQTVKVTGVNLSGIQSKAQITLNSTSSPSVTVDGVSTSGKAITLYFKNNTGKIIQTIYAKQSSEQYYAQNNLLGSAYLGIGDSSNGVSFNYNISNPKYDFYVIYTGGTNDMFSNVDVSVTGSVTQKVVTLGTNGATTGSTTTSGDTKLTFKNNSGSTIYELRMATSTSALKTADAIWENESGLKSGKSVTIDVDLGTTTKWFFGAHSKKANMGSTSKSLTYNNSVSFKKNTTSATLKLEAEDDYVRMDWDDFVDEYDNTSNPSNQYYYISDKGKPDSQYTNVKTNAYDKMKSSLTESEYDDLSPSWYKDFYEEGDEAKFELAQVKVGSSSSSSSSSKTDGDGDVDLYIVNSSTTDIKAIFVVPEEDYKSGKDYDYYSGDFDSVMELDEDEYDIYTGAMDAGEYYHLLFFNSEKSSAKPWASVKVKPHKNAEYLVCNVTGSSISSSNYFDSEDEDARLVFVYNDGSYPIKNIFLSQKKSDTWSTSGVIQITSELKRDYYCSKIIDIKDEDEWYVQWKDEDEDPTYEDIDFGDYGPVILLTIDDDEIEIEDMD